MESRLVRIVADKNGQTWGDWAANLAHKNFKYSPLGLIVPSYVPSAEKIKSAGNAIYGAASTLASLVHKGDNGEIEDIAASQSSGLRVVDELNMEEGAVYGEHPLVKGVFIRADNLHTFLIKEQRAQIIRYFRGAVALKSLTIEIISQSSGKFYASGGWKEISGAAGKEAKEERRHWFTATYTEPRRESQERLEELFWMPYFDEILATTKDASGGTIETTTVLDTSYGISMEAAKYASIDANWISRQSFLVKAEYV